MARLFSMTMTKDFAEAWEKVIGEREISEYHDYWKKYGFVEVGEVFWYFEQLGRLLQRDSSISTYYQYHMDRSSSSGKKSDQ